MSVRICYKSGGLSPEAHLWYQKNQGALTSRDIKSHIITVEAATFQTNLTSATMQPSEVYVQLLTPRGGSPSCFHWSWPV